MKRNWMVLIVVIGLLSLFGVYYLWMRNQGREANVFERVIPGKTTQVEVRLLLGKPDNIQLVNEYQVLEYQQTINGWFSVYFWINPVTHRVEVIQAQTDPASNKPETELLYWANKYGVPSTVAWTYDVQYYRHLAWPEKGVSIITLVQKDLTLQIAEVYIYSPIPNSEYMNKAQASPFLLDISPYNRFERGTTDNPDTAPLDPFDWSMISTPAVIIP